nr:hypothetical protein [Arthrospira sp. PLM2.Bin9]
MRENTDDLYIDSHYPTVNIWMMVASPTPKSTTTESFQGGDRSCESLP